MYRGVAERVRQGLIQWLRSSDALRPPNQPKVSSVPNDCSIIVEIYSITIRETPITILALTPRPTHKPANSNHAALELKP